MSTRLRASVFRKAAKLVAPTEALEEKGGYGCEFACNCIDRVVFGAQWTEHHDSPERQFFQLLFRCGGTFNNAIIPGGFVETEDCYPIRLIALELAALCVEDGMTLEDLQ